MPKIRFSRTAFPFQEGLLFAAAKMADALVSALSLGLLCSNCAIETASYLMQRRVARLENEEKVRSDPV